MKFSKSYINDKMSNLQKTGQLEKKAGSSVLKKPKVKKAGSSVPKKPKVKKVGSSVPKKPKAIVSTQDFVHPIFTF